MSETSSPSAERTPGRFGKTTSSMSSSAATLQAWTGPAPEADERELAGIEPLVDGGDARGARHLRVDHVADRGRGGFDGHPHRTGDVFSNASLGGLGVERYGPAGERLGVQYPEDEVGVGHGRQFAAAAVTRRSGIGTGAVGPDPERADLVDSGDRTAAGTDRLDVGERPVDLQPLDLPVGHLDRLPIGDGGHVAGRSAHVEGEDVFETALSGEVRGRVYSCDRAGDDLRDGAVRGDLGAREPAVGLHDRDRCLDSRVAEFVLQSVQVRRQLRLEIRVGDRGRGSGVLPDLRRHRRGPAHVDVGRVLGEPLDDRAFVVGVPVGVEETDGDCLDVGREDLVDDAVEIVHVERRDDVSARIDPLFDAEPMPPRDQRCLAIVAGRVQQVRAAIPSPISSTSLNPAVVTIAVFAPVRSMSALTAIVLPWLKPVTSPGSTPVASQMASMPAESPPMKSAVLDVLTAWTSSSPTRTVSVNVPPMSTPIARMLLSLDMDRINRCRPASRVGVRSADRNTIFK